MEDQKQWFQQHTNKKAKLSNASQNVPSPNQKPTEVVNSVNWEDMDTDDGLLDEQHAVNPSLAELKKQGNAAAVTAPSSAASSATSLIPTTLPKLQLTFSGGKRYNAQERVNQMEAYKRKIAHG